MAGCVSWLVQGMTQWPALGNLNKMSRRVELSGIGDILYAHQVCGLLQSKL